MERLAARGHTIRVIDYDIDWKKNKNKSIYTPRQIYRNIHKIFPSVSIEVIRPFAIKLPLFEYLGVLVMHRHEIRRQIKEFKPDIIIGFGILNAWIAAKLAKQSSIPFIYYWIDALDTLIPEKTFQRLGRILERQTLRNSSKIIAINKKLEEYAIKLGADANNTSLIGAGIDLSKFHPDIKGSSIRLSLGIENNDTLLFFMGWLYQFSGLRELILELARSPDTFPHIKVLIVGDGDAFNDLQRIKVENNLGKKVILTGKQPYEKIPEFIAACDICILPADPNEKIMQDIVPIKIYEYMALGKPVICTKLPGILKEFGIGNGILYAESPEEVLCIAKRILSDGTVKKEGRAARDYVQNLDWEVITNNFEQTISEGM
jgi:glycosyltransferase involved in cell wall biosynthesis